MQKNRIVAQQVPLDLREAKPWPVVHRVKGAPFKSPEFSEEGSIRFWGDLDHFFASLLTRDPVRVTRFGNRGS